VKYTYFFTPRSRVLYKLTNFQVLKKFFAFNGSWRFITTFRSARHLSLSWASSIQSMPPHSTSWRSILIVKSHLRLDLPSGFFPHASPAKPCIHLSSPHPCYMPYPSHSSRFDHQKNIGWGVQIIKLLIM